MNSVAKNYRKDDDEWIIGGKLLLKAGAVVIDEAGVLGSGGGGGSGYMKDTVTGKLYKLSVVNGALTMTEVTV